MKIILLIITAMFLLTSCNKDCRVGTTIPNSEKMNYKLYDSFRYVYNTFNQTYSNELHTPCSVDIEVYRLLSLNQLVYMADTFRLDSISNMYVPVSGAFPIIKTNSDSIVIDYYLGGVGQQIWLSVYGKQN